MLNFHPLKKFFCQHLKEWEEDHSDIQIKNSMVQDELEHK